MSRTDKTKPWRVRVMEHNPKAVHEHRDGVCDLPESALEDWTYLGCHWSNDTSSWSCCVRGGCSCCTGRNYSVPANRKDRRETKARLKRGLQDPPERWPSKPKPTGRWCKGKVGRPHVSVIEYSSIGRWKATRIFGKPVCGPSPSWWGPDRDWSCYHQEICQTCGKILRLFVGKTSCPTWLARRSPVQS